MATKKGNPSRWESRPGGVLENPLTGERFVFRKTAHETAGESLVLDFYLAPGRRVPALHAHPKITYSCGSGGLFAGPTAMALTARHGAKARLLAAPAYGKAGTSSVTVCRGW